MLSSLYRYAHVAYIGGGWGRGIHNTLEAVTFGKPVVFGPNHRKFQEAQDLLSLGGGFDYSDYDTLQKVLDSFLMTTMPTIVRRRPAPTTCTATSAAATL